MSNEQLSTEQLRTEQLRTDSVIVAAISALAAVLVIAGLIYAAGTGQRHQAALAAAGCEPNLSPSGLHCTTAQMLASRYRAMSTSVSQQLTTDMAAYGASERHHLASAKAALTAEVAIENAFGTSLARFPFPPLIAPMAKALIQANHARAELTAEQARSSSLTRLRSFNHRVTAADVAVRTDMKLVRKALAAPPTASQEP
jgi:hypothetical protein